jgi:D-beta-D-heptose 7-phosphate kinase/D-beta-D-heptose 1-phosphate adenosyltransferase
MSQSPHILVVGDVMLDRYILGEVTRISPEAPVPVLRTVREDTRPGGAANVAANVAAMGARCTLLGVVGPDVAAHQVEQLVTARGVRAALTTDPTQATTQKTRLVAGTQQIVRFDTDASVTPAARTALLQRFIVELADCDLVILSDYAKGSLDDVAAFVAAANTAGVRCLVDPKQTDPAHYAGAFLLKPNRREFELLFGSGGDMAQRASAALAAQRLSHMVVTLGADGMLLISANGAVHRIATEAQEVFDVSGAGDTVIAALAVAIAGGASVADAVISANFAASIAVSHAGTYVVTAQDMAARLARGRSPSKVLPLEALLPQLAAARQRGRRIVFTNGCFDILHAGHVRMLAACKQLGDLLVLGLNEDVSVRLLKGPARPVNRFEDRAEVLAGLATVDYVVGFPEETPAKLIAAVAPDVLAKGGDYSAESLAGPEAIVGADFVRARGGQVVAVQFHQGYSSTRIIEAARQ